MSTFSAKKRQSLPKSAFAIPEKAPGWSGSGSYPIPDLWLAHARNALARVAQHGTPEEQRRVKSAVYKKFPQLRPSAGS